MNTTALGVTFPQRHMRIWARDVVTRRCGADL